MYDTVSCEKEGNISSLAESGSDDSESSSRYLHSFKRVLNSSSNNDIARCTAVVVRFREGMEAVLVGNSLNLIAILAIRPNASKKQESLSGSLPSFAGYLLELYLEIMESTILDKE